MAGNANRRRIPWARLLASALLVAYASGCAHRDAPKSFPALDTAQAKVRLAIVDVVASDYLPAFPGCDDPDVICMDPAPTWIKLRTLDLVYGDPLPQTFYASTTSHYGKITAYGAVDQPQLMLLLSQGDDIVMARYERARLTVDRARRFHLPLIDRGPRWLPCAVESLREPLADPVLARNSAVPLSLFEPERIDEIRSEGDQGYYRIDGQFAYPRYSLRLDRLEDHLQGRELAYGEFGCRKPVD